MNSLIVVLGPTATGKTKLALSLAKKFNGELISADSRQIYKGMDIGVGKDIEGGIWDSSSKTWIVQSLPIYMLDIKNPSETYDVAQYKRGAEEAIGKIRKKGKLPIIVGGTGFYIDALTMPPGTLGIPQNLALRDVLSHKTREELQKILKGLSPEKYASMNNSDINNPRRLIRAIEVAKSNKKLPVTPPTQQNALFLGLTAPLPYIYKLVDKRIDEMIKNGLLKEIENLMSLGYSWNDPGLKAIGYQEFKSFFEKKESLESCIQKLKYNTHSLVRRQKTYLAKNKNIHWFDISKQEYYNIAQELVQDLLKQKSCLKTTTEPYC